MINSAAAKWAEALGQWALPPEILAAAKVAPWAHDVATFAISPEDIVRDTPSERVALAGLVPGGSVLDVGCGGGRAAFALLPKAGRLIGVDEAAGMLEAFASTAAALDVEFETHLGRWPEDAEQSPSADVVVSHHTAYNVSNIEGLVRELSQHAHQRVVMELPTSHPLSYLNAGWRYFWGLERPTEPTAGLLVEVVRLAGWTPAIEIWRGRWGISDASRETQVDHLLQKLCLSEARRGDVAAFLEGNPLPAERELATLWWDV